MNQKHATMGTDKKGTAKKSDSAIRAANPTVQLHGIPGFHATEEPEDHVPLARMEQDRHEKGRVNTGTGDQPGNSGSSRFATPDVPEDAEP